MKFPSALKNRAILLVCVFFCGLCLVGLLLPAVQAERGNLAGTPIGRCLNNLHQIGLALHYYEDANGRFPPAIVTDKQGKAMHSWRTLILPYLEQSALYRPFKLNEPWDSPNNSKAAATVLRFFYCPSDQSAANRPVTSYLAVTGPGTGWNEQHIDATSYHIMVVEVADSNIPWAKPHDLTLEEVCRGVGDGSGFGVSSHHVTSGDFSSRMSRVVNVLVSDGSDPDYSRRPTFAVDPGPADWRSEGMGGVREFRGGPPPADQLELTAPRWRCSYFPTPCCCFVRGTGRRKRRRHSGCP